MTASLPSFLRTSLARVDPTWVPVLHAGLSAMQTQFPGYLADLEQTGFLPTDHRLFAAFSIPLPEVKAVLIGEGPYPRADSATGFSFMDGAVGDIWASDEHAGLSKKVNRATSLRNFLKMLLVADGQLAVDQTGIAEMAGFAKTARKADSGVIQTLSDLQNNLLRNGFLLLNASLVFRPDVAPKKDAKAWQALLQSILGAFQQYHRAESSALPQLILWGKIAEQIRDIPESSGFPQVESEHPYNLSFIGNRDMQDFFRPLHLMSQR